MVVAARCPDLKPGPTRPSGSWRPSQGDPRFDGHDGAERDARLADHRVIAVIVMSCVTSPPGGAAQPPGATVLRPLPPPRTSSPVSLEAALEQRQSVREFLPDPLSDQELGQLLWAAQGVTDPTGHRPVPSAGALYPLEIYAVTETEILRYDPSTHSVGTHRSGDHRRDLQVAALGQDPVGEAPLTLVIAAVPARTAVKYGDRAARYVHLEAGHAAQNVLLQAVALGLGAVPIGAFVDERVEAVLEFSPGEHPVYLISVGHPR